MQRTEEQSPYFQSPTFRIQQIWHAAKEAENYFSLGLRG